MATLSQKKHEKPCGLTARQLEILELVAKGLTNAEICSVLGISPNTVKAHVAAILKSLDVTNRTEAALVHARGRSAGSPPAPRARCPAVAVLPFKNISTDPDQQDFADALVEDLATRLSAWRILPIISSHSISAQRHPALDFRRIGRELDARYIVHGSVRRFAGRIRTTAQLVDAELGHQIWAESYAQDAQEPCQTRDDLALRIVTSLESEILDFERTRVALAGDTEPGAWERTARGLWHVHRRTAEDSERALACFAEALSHDPTFCLAWIGRARTHHIRIYEHGCPDLA